MFSFIKFRKPVASQFSESDRSAIVNAIKTAEKATTGEIRVYIESRCKKNNPVHRAVAIFHQLKMDNTVHKNGVLLYVAMRDHQLAIWGDVGIHDKVGDDFWDKQVKTMLKHFRQNDYAAGISGVVLEIGEVLHKFFPTDGLNEQNELSDEIVFGN